MKDNISQASCCMNSFFLTIDGSQRFVLNFMPCGDVQINHTMIIIPPFADEMNKSRQSMSLLARRLAGCGYNVILFDLLGTGDSDGDFGDATWQLWLRDIGEIYVWCKTNSHQSISFCAIRTGALLANDFINSMNINIDNLVLWQPVLSGKNYLIHFLRLKIAADMIKVGGAKEGTKELIGIINNNQSVEIAGYRLSPELALPLYESSLRNIKIDSTNIYWLETTLGDSLVISLASTKMIDSMTRNGANINVFPVKGAQFWSTQEITIAHEFVSATETLCCP